MANIKMNLTTFNQKSSIKSLFFIRLLRFGSRRLRTQIWVALKKVWGSAGPAMLS